jgi:glycosyltransferase involved in cell wall biosynthesis
LTLLQREMLSTLATVERFTKAPRVFDVDDAIWLLRGGRSACSLARLSDMVICGNAFIAGFFERHARTAILPTAVDTERFRPSGLRKNRETQIICWSGTSSGFPFLYAIEPQMRAALRAGPHRRLRIVSDARPSLQSIRPEQVEFVRWSQQSEVPAIQDADVAIMPLDNSQWARGKCAYKLLTYMACGIPVIASPVGMNRELLADGRAGISAHSSREWTDALEFLLNSPDRGSAMGAAGRELVAGQYSLHALTPRFAAILQMARAAAN